MRLRPWSGFSLFPPPSSFPLLPPVTLARRRAPPCLRDRISRMPLRHRRISWPTRSHLHLELCPYPTPSWSACPSNKNGPVSRPVHPVQFRSSFLWLLALV